MAEPARKVAQKAAQKTEDRLDKVADVVREKFEQLTDGQPADQVDKSVDQGRADDGRKDRSDPEGSAG